MESPFQTLKFEKLNSNQKTIRQSLFPGQPLKINSSSGRSSLLEASDLLKISLSPSLKSLILEKRKNQKKFRSLNHFSQLNPHISENITRITLEMTEDTRLIILEGLKSHFLFYNLSDDVLSSLIKAMFPCSLDKHIYLFKQGENASHFFFLEKGILQLFINNHLKKELWPGTAFGELALIYNAVRSASISALEDCVLWCLDRTTFSNFFKEINERLYRENRNFLDSVAFFRFLIPHQKDTLALNLSKQCFQKNDIIINQGEIATSFYIIMFGSVNVYIDKVQFCILNEGQCFGESSLILDTNVKGTVIAESPTVVCLAIGFNSLKQMFGENLEKMALKYLIKVAFEKNVNFCHLTEMQKFKIIDLMIIRELTSNEPIDLQKPMIFVPLQGDLINEKGEVLRKNGEIFGDVFLMDLKYHYNGKLFLTGKRGILAEIQIDILKKELKFDRYDDFIQENCNSHEHSHFFADSREEASNQFLNDLGKSKGSYEEIKSNCHLFNFIQTPIIPTIEFLQKIKEGQMALISIVMNNEKNFYIMKSYQTSWLSKFKSLSNYIRNEEEVVKFCNFPFIMEYFKSNQESDYNLLLVKYVKGVDLFEVLRQLGLLEISQARFYMGSLILTLQYLHQHHIIYRDLKPDNVMVDTTGYIKLIDMGTAKFLGRASLNSDCSSISDSLFQQINSSNSQVFDAPNTTSISKLNLSPIKTKQLESQMNCSYSISKSDELKKSVHNVRTFTIIGTPHYMAPEIIIGQGYSFPVDYWALGIMLYEFLCGYVPFGDDMEDPYEIYEKIVKKKGKVKFPAYMADKKAKELISQLLNKSPDARLAGSFAALKNHEFFNGFEWNDLLDRKILPPFLPLEGVDFIAEKEMKKQAIEEGKIDVIDYLTTEHERIKKNLLL